MTTQIQKENQIRKLQRAVRKLEEVQEMLDFLFAPTKLVSIDQEITKQTELLRDFIDYLKGEPC
jgi:hypothetical protein